jgi:2-polyprenyl-3-methyl-5-hydroxy-6-metoxy-1,4-benzoquinol methylase
MVNWLLSRVHRPEAGWDPVPREHALHYGQNEWQGLNEAVLTELEAWVGGFAGKRVLDLGGGPGQYAVAFAQRGAEVTWFDVSKTYEDMARAKAEERGVGDKIQFRLGYLDEAPGLLSERYDLVFNRICWYYGWSDRGFADVCYELVAAGGSGYIDTTNSRFHIDKLSASARARTWLNDALGLKVGHPYPPRGRVARLLLRRPVARLLVDYPTEVTDRIFFQKPPAAP